MPVRRIGGREGPLDGAPGQAIMNVGICDDALMIVQDDKRVPNDWAVERDGDGCQQNAGNGVQLVAGEEWPWFREALSVAASCGFGHVLSCSIESMHGLTRPWIYLIVIPQTPEMPGGPLFCAFSRDLMAGS
jgi:hypothetical protein